MLNNAKECLANINADEFLSIVENQITCVDNDDIRSTSFGKCGLLPDVWKEDK